MTGPIRQMHQTETYTIPVSEPSNSLEQTPDRFEAIYRACGPKVLSLAFRFTRDEESARELTQEVFIKIYRNLDSFREQSAVSTWVYRIAMNHILNHLKSERRRRWKEMLNQNIADVFSGDETEPRNEAVSTDETPDVVMERGERERIVAMNLDALPVKYRVPLVMFHSEGLSYQEIADALQLSLSAVEARIHRAKKMLIKRLEPWV